MKIDLHNHSNYSDGLLSVEDLIKLAQKKNIDIMALTDHDSVYGVLEAVKYGEKYGVKVIKGIELSTYYNNESVHIIGLFKKGIVPNEIYNLQEEMNKKRRSRAIIMMNKVKEIYGVNMDIEKLLESKDIITRGNMFTHLVEYNKDIDPSELNKMISNDSKAYIESAKFDTAYGIEYLKKNNCFTIYAHPTLSKPETVEEVLKLGVEGIEYNYPKNKAGDKERFIELAKKYNILLSAGSDFHGDIKHDMIGTSTLPYQEFLKIWEVIK